MGNIEENEDVNCCVSFAFKYIISHNGNIGTYKDIIINKQFMNSVAVFILTLKC